MARTVLLTLGRLPPGVDFARAFHRAGWRVIVAEPQRWHVTGMSRSVARCLRTPAPMRDPAGYLAALAAIASRENVDLVLPISDEITHVAGLHRGLKGPAPSVFAPPQAEVLRLHDKQRFIAAACAYGLPAPQTCALEDSGAAELARRGDFVVKPVFSCSGRGVRFFRSGEAPPAPEPGARAILQAFVPGDVRSSFGLAHRGRLLAHVAYRGLAFSGAVAVAFERVVGLASVEDWAARFVAASGHSGFISFDFIVAADGSAQAIECNPRVTSGAHFLEPDDLVAAMLDPENAPPVRFRPQMRLQQFYTTLAGAQIALWRDRAGFAERARLLALKDVVWSAADPLPFLTMTLTSAPLLWRAARSGSSIAELVTMDIGWPGETAAKP